MTRDGPWRVGVEIPAVYLQPMGSATDQTGGEEMVSRLKTVEERLARLETYLGVGPVPEKVGADGAEVCGVEESVDSKEDAESLEVELAGNGFAAVGIVVLVLGVIFLLTFSYHGLPAVLPSLAGYVLLGAMVGCAHLWRDSFQQLSRYLVGGASFLAYFATLRLSHFSAQPVVSYRPLEVVLLLLAVGVNLAVAMRRRSVFLASMHVLLGYFTALVAGDAGVLFSLVVAVALVAVWLRREYGWDALHYVGLLGALVTHGIWMMNNPVFGNPVRMVDSPEWNLLFPPLYALLFGMARVAGRRGEEESLVDALGAVLGGVGSFVIVGFMLLTGFKSHVAAWNLYGAVIYLGLATSAWVAQGSRYNTFVYAMLGYTAVSAAIVAAVGVRECFVWLCWQSMLVVSTAVWFRSRFIVVANFGIFLGIFGAYLIAEDSVTAVSISFGLVALATARILNWQRDRLELKTELMRNAYLATALFVIPYALYHTVPRGWVSLSWLGVAALYYSASRILHNAKYRWMALLTMILTVLWVFLMDLVALNPVLRIFSFLVLGTALLVISTGYTRRRGRGVQEAGVAKAASPPEKPSAGGGSGRD